MKSQPTLRRELVGAAAAVFAGALFFAVAGILLIVPRLSPGTAAAYVVVLLLVDVALFSMLGAWLLRTRLIRPLDRTIAAVEEVSRGNLEARIPPAETQELSRLSAAVAQMAEHLLEHQRVLTDNIRSLDDTNRLLTEARDAMVLNEKLASVGRLGSGIAHEVGNPLSAIIGYLALLARQQEGQKLELVEAAMREAQRIDRIVRGLLDFARPRDAVTQAVDATLVVRDTVELVRTQGHLADVEVHCRLPDTPLHVRGDPYQLQQVLVNLIVNACDAVSGRPGGLIEIEAHARPVERPLASALPARRRSDPPGINYAHRRRLAIRAQWRAGDPVAESGYVVEILVADNGPGIPTDLVDRVFEPFVTTKEPGKGTGLGLAVCARLTEGMGGVIHAGNAEQGGAVFRVILPAQAAEEGNESTDH